MVRGRAGGLRRRWSHPALRARSSTAGGPSSPCARSHRGRGVGSELYARVSRAADAAGKSALHVLVSEASGDGHRLAGAARLPRVGAHPPGRARSHGLPRLRRRPSPRASRSSRSRSAPTCSRPCTPSPVRPSQTSPAATRRTTRARSTNGSPAPSRLRASSPDAFFVALADGAGRGVCEPRDPRRAPGHRLARHDGSGPRAARAGHRNRAQAGDDRVGSDGGDCERLQTENNIGNASMRAVNARLGYRPLPDEIVPARAAGRHRLILPRADPALSSVRSTFSRWETSASSSPSPRGYATARPRAQRVVGPSAPASTAARMAWR